MHAGKQLSFPFAKKLAASLKTVGDFPWDADVIQAVAEDLMRWCEGGVFEGHIWPAEAQAEWLVTEVREKWEKWRGTAAMRETFNAKFKPKVRASNEVENYDDLPCPCARTGKKFKDCCKVVAFLQYD